MSRRMKVGLPALALVAANILPFGAGPAAHADGPSTLSAGDVTIIIAQGVARAQRLAVAATIAVTDREGNTLGIFRMSGARVDVRIGRADAADPDGLALSLPVASGAAVSKAGTAAMLSSQGSAISTRTLGFIIQQNFPPGMSSQPGGDLFGVQFSQLPCSDVVVAPLPLGLSGDPGGIPIYKNGFAAGGVGVEVDGVYGIELVDSAEEDIAVAATWGFEAPTALRADNIVLNGTRLSYARAPMTPEQPASLTEGTMLSGVRSAPASRYVTSTLGGVPVQFDPRFPVASDSTEDSLPRKIAEAAQQAAVTLSAIRLPAGQAVQVSVAAVDVDGAVLALLSTQDAPEFGFDVAVQKARTAVFFSRPDAGAQLRAAGLARYADAAAAEGIALAGATAFSSRAIGFVARPFFPDGQDTAVAGPLSSPVNVFGPFSTGLQTALVRSALLDGADGAAPSGCTALPGLRNGMQTGAGAIPLYGDGVLVGAIGVSGDGIAQDETIAAAASQGLQAPPSMRADQLTVRGVAVPYLGTPAPTLP